MIGFMIVNRQLKKERTHMFVVEFEGDLKKKKGRHLVQFVVMYHPNKAK